MKKQKIALTIATALYPAHFPSDSPAITGEVEQLMKHTKSYLHSLLDTAQRIHVQRSQSKEYAAYTANGSYIGLMTLTPDQHANMQKKLYKLYLT